MKKVRTLCVIIFLIFTIFIPTINATTVKEEYQNKIIEKIYLIKSIVSKDDHISQNPYNITNFWDWFLFVFLPWFYLNFPNLFNLTRLSILLLIVIFDRLCNYLFLWSMIFNYYVIFCRNGENPRIFDIFPEFSLKIFQKSICFWYVVTFRWRVNFILYVHYFYFVITAHK